MSYKDYLSKLYRPNLNKNNRNDFVCLDKNEPPFCAFDVIDNLLTDDDIKSLRVYPDPYELYEKLAKFVQVNINEIIITQGSEQALEFIFRVFLDKNDEVVYLNPTFAMFDVFAYVQNANVKTIEFDDKIELSLDKVISTITSKTKLFVLANPNNPTGTSFNFHELEKLAQHTKKTQTTFVLDEAYFHYFDVNSAILIKDFDHIIITRTFSKALGIAGARVGYAISNPKNIDLLRKLKPIDEINQLSNILAKKVIDNADVILDKNLTQVNKWKNIFRKKELKNMKYVETQGNFILLQSNTYAKHKQLFLENMILPKMDFTQSYLKNCFRLSIRDDIVMTKIIETLNKK